MTSAEQHKQKQDSMFRSATIPNLIKSQNLLCCNHEHR
jgi:hypothetical protein